MLLPIGDQPNPRGVAVVNTTLIAVNLAVFLFLSLPLTLQRLDPEAPGAREFVRTVARATRTSEAALARSATAYDLFLFRSGFRPSDPSLPDLLVSMFLHAGFLHLIGNMLFLWIFGDNVEQRLGSAAYLIAYVFTGVAATLFHAIVFHDSPLPLVGASGAISGVMGFYFWWFPRNLVRVLVWFYFYIEVLLIPARWVLGFFLVVENLLPFVVGAGSSGVAYGAHIGGFIAGIALARLLDARVDSGRGRRWLDAHDAPDDGGAPWLAEPSPHTQVQMAIAADRLDEATRLYLELPPRERALLSPADVLALADWLDRQAFSEVVLAVLQRYLAARAPARELAPVHLTAGLLALHRLHQPTLAYQHLAIAARLDPGPEVQSAVAGALEEILQMQKLRVTPRRP